MYKFLLPLFTLAVLLMSCTPAVQNPKVEPPLADEEAALPAGFNGQLLTGMHRIDLHTSKGDITLELDASKAPKTVTNFVILASLGYYDGLTFHRIIPDFMVQGGDPVGDGTGGESIFGETFEDEPNDISLDRGVIAMANRGPDTNGSQFFIIQRQGGTPWLQGKHTAFGKVVDGMEVVDAIVASPRDERDVPNDPITFDVEVK